MKKTFLVEHSGPYLIFGDFLYPASSFDSENYIARPTPSGSESRLGFLDPISIKDIEANEKMAKRIDIIEYERSMIASLSNTSMDPASFRDRLSTVKFILETIPFLAETKEDETLSPELVASEVIGRDPIRQVISRERIDRLMQQLSATAAKPFFDSLPDEPVLRAQFPPESGLCPDTSVLSRCLNMNAGYCADGYFYQLRTSPRKGSDRIHVKGKDYFWSRRHKIEWIEPIYLKMLKEVFHPGIELKLKELANTQESFGENPAYLELCNLEEFSFRNLNVKWIGKKCYLMMKRGKFARQDYENADKWHPRGEFEIGGAFYYSGGQIFFGETPVVLADYKDVAFFTRPLGMFRMLCGERYFQDAFVWTPRGAATYVREALDVFYNGFSPKVVRKHIYHFGDGDYHKVCPLENAITASTLKEVRDQGYDPVNIHLPLKGEEGK